MSKGKTRSTMAMWLCRLLGILVAFWAGMVNADCRIQLEETQKERGVLQRIVLENELVKYVLYPQFGARAGELWYKPKGINVAAPDYDANGFPTRLGGMLDGGSTAVFQFKVLQNSPELASIEFYRPDSPAYKRLTLRKGSAVLQVDRQYVNAGQSTTGEYAYKVKSFPWPDGEPPNTGAVSLCVPTTKAVRVLTPGKRARYREMLGKFMVNVGDGWLSTSGAKQGVTYASVFAEDSLWAYYWWRYRSVAKGTHEWVYRKLPAGKMQQIRSYVILFNGLPPQVDITRDYAASLDRTVEGRKLTLKLTLLSLFGDLEEVRVRTQLASFDGKILAELPNLDLGKIPLNGKAEGALAWEGDLAGNLLIKQQVFAAGKEIGHYEDALKPDGIPESYTRAIDLPEPKILDVPGWQKEEVKTIEVTPRDRQSGAKLYVDEFASSAEAWGRPLKAFALDCVRDEWESFAVAFLPVEYEGEVTVEASDLAAVGTGKPVSGRIVIRVEQRQDVSDIKAGKTGLWARWLDPQAAFQAQKGKATNVWFTVDTHGLPPGDYTSRIVFAYGPRKLEFDLQLKVWALSYPIRPLLHLEVEHHFELLPGLGDPALLQAYLDDFRRHRMTVFQDYGARTFHRATKQADGSWDFSAYDDLINRVLDAGLVRFMTQRFQAPAFKGAAAAYLRSRGYPPAALWLKNRDEVPTDQFPSMVEQARVWMDAGWNVFSTFHDVTASGKQTRYLSPYFRMFQGGLNSRADYAKRLAAGDLDFSNEMWRYNGWGACWITYTGRLNPGWASVALGLDGWHLHVYNRGKLLDALARVSKDRPPVDSAAFEGARDSIEAASLYRLAQYQIMKLEQQGQAADAVAKQALTETVGDGKAIINRRQSVHGITAWEQLKTPTVAEHYQARRKVLQVLTDLAPHAANIAPDLYWGRFRLATDGQVHFQITGDQNAKAMLETALRDTFGIDCRKLAKQQQFSIHLAIDKTLGSGRYTLADSNPWHWRLLAGDEAGMKRGLKNVVALMTPYSIRHILSYGLARPEF